MKINAQISGRLERAVPARRAEQAAPCCDDRARCGTGVGTYSVQSALRGSESCTKLIFKPLPLPHDPITALTGSYSNGFRVCSLNLLHCGTVYYNACSSPVGILISSPVVDCGQAWQLFLSQAVNFDVLYH